MTETLPSKPGTLRALALSALSARFMDSPFLSQDRPEAAYLRARAWEAHALPGSDPVAWPRGLANWCAEPPASDRGLARLARWLRLSEVELLAAALATAVEEELMVGRVLAYIQAPVGGSRPSLGLLATLFDGQPVPSSIYQIASGAALKSGLLTLVGAPAPGSSSPPTAGPVPLPEQALCMPQHLVLALSGQARAYPGAVVGRGPFPPVALPPSLVAEARRQSAGLRAGSVDEGENGAGQNPMLAIQCGSPAEGRAAALVIAAALDRQAVFLEAGRPGGYPGLVPWLLLLDLLPVFCHSLAPGERLLLPDLPYYPGPLLALGGADGSIETAAGTGLAWRLPVPNRAERQELWTQALGESAGSLAADLARDHRHGAGRIAHLGRLACQLSRAGGRSAPAPADLAASAWSGEGSSLSALAQPLPDSVSDAALVTTPDLQQHLDLLLLRCRRRDGLTDGLGASASTRYHPGVRALLVGPSGTGKTLAAGWLATRLGLPLYRVDLASVTSKYIGETEKNLAQLMALAEQAEVVLLFDEADSLFARRTDVKEANDRFANAQTNYLLQRIETFDGIALLTSNSRSRFDPAFSRRLDMIIDFPLPGPEQRRLLWESHLGEHPGLSARQINRLAVAADLTGGSIRNVVLTAAVLAQSAASPIDWKNIQVGLALEYNKIGRHVPPELIAAE